MIIWKCECKSSDNVIFPGMELSGIPRDIMGTVMTVMTL